jgi:hypothetical protein
MLSSELTEAPKKASANSGGRTGYARKATTTLREFTPNNTGYSSNRYESRYWSESEVDLNDDTQNRLYVSWFNYDTSLQNGEDIDIRQLRGELMAAGIEMPELYGMKPNQIKRVAKKDNWMSVEEWAKMAFEVYLDENDVKEILQLNSALKCTDWILPLVQMLGNSEVSVNEDTILGNLLNKVGSEKSSKNAGKILAIAKRLKYNVGNDDDSIGEEVKELAKQCEERYTFLMDWIDRSYIQNTDKSVVQNLIKMVEAFDLCN